LLSPKEVILQMKMKTEWYREPIPEDCPKAYSQLIKDCWAEKPQDRPEMKDVVQRLNDILKQTAQPSASHPASSQITRKRQRQVEGIELRALAATMRAPRSPSGVLGSFSRRSVVGDIEQGATHTQQPKRR